MREYVDTRYQLAVTQQKVSNALARLEKLFAAHCKLTFIMRNPQVEDGDMILTQDDLEKVEAAIKRLKEREGNDQETNQSNS
jgi:hypothetical protein